MKRGETYGNSPAERLAIENALDALNDAVRGQDSRAVLAALLMLAARTAAVLGLRRKDWRDNALRHYDAQRSSHERK